jgi:hypothetical protein
LENEVKPGVAARKIEEQGEYFPWKYREGKAAGTLTKYKRAVPRASETYETGLARIPRLELDGSEESRKLNKHR